MYCTFLPVSQIFLVYDYKYTVESFGIVQMKFHMLERLCMNSSVFSTVDKFLVQIQSRAHGSNSKLIDFATKARYLNDLH